MREILITGGAGFIGSALAEKLLKAKHKVVIVDNLSTGKKSNIPVNKNCIFYKRDVNMLKSISSIFLKHHFKYVFHFAACVGVELTLNNPTKVLLDIDGFKNIFLLSVKSKVKHIYFSSSSEVYGEPVHLPQDEKITPLNSRLPYAIVKNVGEAFCKSYYKTYGLKYTIFRLFNTYGPKQSNNFVISKFLNFALTNKNLRVYGNGRQARTFCYIDDTIQAIHNTLISNYYDNDIINIGHNETITMSQLARLIINITDSKSKIIFTAPLKEGDMTKRQPQIYKMKKILNNKLTTLEDGLKKIIKIKKIKI